MYKIKTKVLVVVAIMAIFVAGIFYFFYVPKPACDMLRDPSGNLSEVCSVGGRQSPYQKIFLAVHKYFYPSDMCVVSIETGKIQCRPFPSTACDQSATTTPCSVLENMRLHPPQRPIATSTPVSAWETFENTAYGYSILVPAKNTVIGQDILEDIHKRPALLFLSGEGGAGYILIRAEYPRVRLGDEATVEQKKLLALNLKSYAEKIQDFQIRNVPYLEFGSTQKLSHEDMELVNFSNPPNKKVGEMKRIQFAGTEAYEFTVEGMGGLFLGLPDGHGGYILAPDVPQKYIILENFRKQKIIISYTVNNVTEKMIQSIKFTE